MSDIKGKVGLGVLPEEAARVQASLLKDDYESHEFTVPGGGLVDSNLTVSAPTAFATILRAHTVIIRTTANISFRFNSVARPAVSLSVGEASFSINALEVSALFLTAPAGAQIKVLLI